MGFCLWSVNLKLTLDKFFFEKYWKMRPPNYFIVTKNNHVQGCPRHMVFCLGLWFLKISKQGDNRPHKRVTIGAAGHRHQAGKWLVTAATNIATPCSMVSISAAGSSKSEAEAKAAFYQGILVASVVKQSRGVCKDTPDRRLIGFYSVCYKLGVCTHLRNR